MRRPPVLGHWRDPSRVSAIKYVANHPEHAKAWRCMNASLYKKCDSLHVADSSD